MNEKEIKIIFIAFLILLVLLSFLIVKPFLAAIAMGAILAYILFPIYGLINRLVKERHVAAGIVSIIFVIALSFLAYFLISRLAFEISFLYIKLRQFLLQFPKMCPEAGEFVCSIVENPTFISILQEFGKSVANWFAGQTSAIFLAIPKIILNILITIIATFFFLLDGENLIAWLMRLLPLKKEQSKIFFKRMTEIIYSVLIGTLIVAIIEGFLASLGYFIFGIKNPIFLGILTALVAFLPILGAWIIWIPFAIWLLVTGKFLLAFGFIIYFLVLVSGIDTLVKPLIVAGKAQLHPLLIVLGVFGGISFIGLVGIFLGPIILAILKVVIDMAKGGKNEIQS